jgi:hypothetical protein
LLRAHFSTQSMPPSPLELRKNGKHRGYYERVVKIGRGTEVRKLEEAEERNGICGIMGHGSRV